MEAFISDTSFLYDEFSFVRFLITSLWHEFLIISYWLLCWLVAFPCLSSVMKETLLSFSRLKAKFSHTITEFFSVSSL